MTVYDVTLELHDEMLCYPGDPPFVSTPHRVIRPSDPESCALTGLALSTHTGTHVDAPAHFVDGGMTVDELPLDVLSGPARVLDFTGQGSSVTAALLEGHDLVGVERLLLKTDNGARLERFDPHYVHLTEDGARHLRDRIGLRLAGIDYLSIEAHASPGFPVHRTLLGEDPPIVILEGLDLREIPAGDYQLTCLPLRIRGADGAPVRAVLTS